MKLLHQGNQHFCFKQVFQLDDPVHVHSAVEIVVMREDSSEAICGRERYSLSAGDIFVAFPHQIHGYENTRDCKGYLLDMAYADRKDCGEVLLQSYICEIMGKLLQKLTRMDAEKVPADALTEYLTSVRMPEACQLLVATDFPVSRIAMEQGFGSIRSFAACMGVSPTHYRHQHCRKECMVL